ncbi:hypothetical protein ABNX05_11050 [Lysinibacillus sp. M3]|uniref:Uncharacterized protein n=1 Tax=Lysinibacillus zambalensis TaxID=3160866 RepID=A0ABV1MRL2_9BACI
MKEPLEVYRILDKESNEPQGVYWRGNYNKYDFESVESARSSNVHGIYKDKGKYKIAKYKITYELIDDDCDNAKVEEKKDVPSYDNLIESIREAINTLNNNII